MNEKREKKERERENVVFGRMYEVFELAEGLFTKRFGFSKINTQRMTPLLFSDSQISQHVGFDGFLK